MTVLKREERFISKGSSQTVLYYFDFAGVLALLMRWILAGRRKALSNSESQTIEAELGTASRMFYFSTASRKRFVANLLACLHDLHRWHCHHHPLVLYTEDRHILPLKLFSLHVPVVQMIAPDMTVCSCSDIRNMTPDAAAVIPLPTYISPSDASLLNLQPRPMLLYRTL